MSRWLSILEAFELKDVWGVRELATHVRLAPSVVHRILHEMDTLGIVAAAGRPGQFRVGPELTRLAVLVANRLDVRQMAQPILDEAASQIDETVILALYSPNSTAVLGSSSGRARAPNQVYLGESSPLEWTSSGSERACDPRLPA